MNYNEAINKTSYDYSNLSVKEGKAPCVAYGGGNLANESSLIKAKDPGLIVR